MPHEKKHLLVGDFVCPEKSICIERKKVDDFVNSMRCGRLPDQLLNMQSNYQNNYLLISGKFENLYFKPHYRNFSVEQRLGMLASLAVRYNVKILQVENDNQLLKLITKIIAKTDDGKIVELSLVKRTSGHNVFLSLLQAIPKISKHRADQIKQKYPCFEDLFDAVKNDSFEMKGFGKGLKANLRDALLRKDL